VAACAGRRSAKLVSLITSCFSANYVRLWPTHLPDVPLQRTPLFDGRAVLYPSDQAMRDYLSWRQVDTHINNLV
jgi:tRNA(His) guanylyltransferase